LRRLSQILPFRRVPFATPIANPTLQKGTFCDAHRKSYPSEGYLLQHLLQILPFRRVPFAMPVTNPTLQKGIFCDACRKSYPSEKLDTNQRLTCIDSSVYTGTNLEGVTKLNLAIERVGFVTCQFVLWVIPSSW
jgi:hypothetical protein